MPIREQITNMQIDIVLSHEFTGIENFAGAILDTKRYDFGYAFAMIVVANDGSNTVFTMHIEHGDEPDLSDAEPVPKEMMVYGRNNEGVLPWLTGNTVEGTPSAKLPAEGVFSTKEYLRTRIETTLWDGTDPSLAYVIAIKNPEIIPVTQRLGPIA
jgi:hypothetical protein